VVKFSTNPFAPEFHRKLVAEMNRVFGSYGQTEAFASTDLPGAEDYKMRTVYASDLNTLVLSDGVNWYPVQLGAAL
jgi:hypothetical protein